MKEHQFARVQLLGWTLRVHVADDAESAARSDRIPDQWGETDGCPPTAAQDSVLLPARGLKSSPSFHTGRSPPSIRTAPVSRQTLPTQAPSQARVSVPLVDTSGRLRPPPASTSSPTPPHHVAGKGSHPARLVNRSCFYDSILPICYTDKQELCIGRI